MRGIADDRKSEPTLLNPGGTRTHEANSESTLFNPGGSSINSNIKIKGIPLGTGSNGTGVTVLE